MSTQTFPIFCKNEVYSHKILSQHVCHTVQKKTDGMAEFGISISDFGSQLFHHVYENFLKDQYEESTEKEFNYDRINTQNEMTRMIGTFKPTK